MKAKKGMPPGMKLLWVVSSPKKSNGTDRKYGSRETAILKSVQHLLLTRSELITINGPKGQIVNVFRKRARNYHNIVIDL